MVIKLIPTEADADRQTNQRDRHQHLKRIMASIEHLIEFALNLIQFKIVQFDLIE